MRQALSPVTARRVCEALRSIGIALAGMSLAALVFACAISGAAPVPTVATVAAAGLDVAMAEVQFLDLLNADRVANGLPPMEPDPRLMELARWRSEDLVARDYFSHDIGGYNVFQVMRDQQIDYWLAGENLAYNTYDAEESVAVAERGLMNSPAHRENILRPEFTLVGVGVATGPDGKTVYTQLFVQD